MSKTIDERVVEMKLNNADFEKNATQSLGTIDKLKKAFNFKGVGKDLEGIGAAAKNINMSSLENNVNSVSKAFTGLQAVATGALMEIGSKVANAGMKISNDLFVAPKMDGFHEYELKMNSVKTILNSTGESLDVVNGYLEELNRYSDETIYSFSDMTNSIGKFTNAGVDLETAVKAIQGISNEAALSGANAEQASHAMYNFAQALSAGSVKLIDWKSIENAQMATVEFKNVLIDTAVELGTLTQEGDMFISTTTDMQGKTSDLFNATTAFNDSLSSQWMTTEVLTAALAKYSDSTTELGQRAFEAATEIRTFSALWDTLKETAGSGWAQTFEIIFGNLEEATHLWTTVGNAAGAALEAMAGSRNAQWQSWADAGGYKAFVETIEALVDVISSYAIPIWEAWNEVFDPVKKGEALAMLTGMIRDFIKSLELSGEGQENLKATVKGLLSIVDIAKKVIFGLINVIGGLIGGGSEGTSGLANSFLAITAVVGDTISSFDELLTKTNAISKVFEVLSEGVKMAMSFISMGVVIAADAVSSLVGELDFIPKSIRAAADSAEDFGESIKEGFAKAADKVKNNPVVKAVVAFGMVIKRIFQDIAADIKMFFDDLGIDDIINIFATGSMGVFAHSFYKFVKNFNNITGNIKDSAVAVLESLEGVLETYQTNIRANIIMKIAEAVVMLAGAIIALTLVDQDKAKNATLIIGGLFGALTIATKFMSGMLPAFIKGLDGLKGIPKQMASVQMFNMMMVSLSLSVMMLANAVRMMGDLDLKQLAAAFGVTIGLMFGIVRSMEALSDIKGQIVVSSLTIIAFAGAVKIMASAMKDMGEVDAKSLAEGLLVMASAMLAIVGTFRLMKASTIGPAVPAAILAFAGALYVLTETLKSFEDIDIWTIVKGLATFSVIIVAMSKSLKTIAAASRGVFVSTAPAILALALAIKMLVPSIKALGRMDLWTLVKGLGALGVAISAFSKVMAATSKMGTVGAGMLVALAGAVSLLVPAIALLGSMDLWTIVKGLIGLVGVLGSLTLVIGGLALITTLAPGLTLAGSALLMIGGAIALIGAGIAMAAGGLATLITAINANIMAFDSFKAALLNTMSQVGPKIAAGIGDIIVETIKSIIRSIGTILDGIVEISYELVDKLAKALTYAIAALADNLPELLESFNDFVLKLIKGLRQYAPTWVYEFTALLTEVLSAVVKSLKQFDSTTLIEAIAGFGLMGVFVKSIAAVTPYVPRAMIGLVEIGALIAELGLIVAAIGALNHIPYLNEFIEEGGKFLETLGNALGHFIGGIAGGVLEGASDSLPKVAKNLTDFASGISPFMNMVKGVDDNVSKNVENISDAILSLAEAKFLNSAGNLLDFFTGSKGISDFSTELVTFGKAVVTFAEQIDSIDSAKIEAAANLGSMLAQMSDSIPKSGGIIQAFLGETNIPEFNTNLVGFGEAIAGFGEKVKDISADKVEAGAKAGELLGKMAEHLPKVGGLIGMIEGDPMLGMFAEGVTSLGVGIASYAESVSEISDVDKVTKSVEAANALAGLYDHLPKLSGLVSFLEGDQSLKTFGEHLADFGNSLSIYSTNIADVSPWKVEKSAAAIEVFVGVEKTLSKIDTTTGVHVDAFGDMIVDLSNGLVKYASNTENLDPSDFTNTTIALKRIAESFKVISDAHIKPEEVKSFFENMTFGDEIVAFGKAMVTYSNAVKDVDFGVVESSANAAKSLAQFASIVPTVKGLDQLSAHNIAIFGSQLAQFGPYFNQYSHAVSGINMDVVQASGSAAKSLAEFAAQLPQSGDAEKIKGNSLPIVEFGKQLAQFGPYFKMFSTAVTGITPETAQSSQAAAEALKALTSGIPENIGEIVSTLSQDVGNNLVTLGEHLVAYSNAVSNGLNTEAMKNASDAMDDILFIVSRLAPYENKFGSMISKFAVSMEPLGKGIVAFSNSLDGYSPEKVNSAIKAINDFLTAIHEITTEKAKSLNEFTESLKNLGTTSINGFAEGLASASTTANLEVSKLVNNIIQILNDGKNKIDQSASGMLSGVTSGLTSESGKAKTAAEGLISGVVSAINAKSSDVSNVGKSIVKTITTELSAGSSAMKTAGVTLYESFKSGLSSDRSLASAITQMLDDAVTEIRSKRGAFERAGEYLSDGLRIGINSKSHSVISEAGNMAKKALAITRKVTDERSPSRETRKIGEFFSMGMAIGIMKMSNRPVQAAAQMAANTIAKTQKVTKNAVTGKKGGILLPVALSTMVVKAVSSMTSKAAGESIKSGIKEVNDIVHDAMHSEENYIERYVRKFSDKQAEMNAANRNLQIASTLSSILGFNKIIENDTKNTAKSVTKTLDTAIETARNNLKSYGIEGKKVVIKTRSDISSAISNLNKALTEDQAKVDKEAQLKEYQDYQKQIADLEKEKSEISPKNNREYKKQVEEKEKQIADLKASWAEKIANKQRDISRNALNNLISNLEDYKAKYERAVDQIMSMEQNMAEKLQGYGELIKSTTDEETGETIYSLDSLDEKFKVMETYSQNLTKLQEKLNEGDWDIDIMDKIRNMDVDEANRYMGLLLKLGDGQFREYMTKYERNQKEAQRIASVQFEDYYKEVNKTFGEELPRLFEQYVNDSFSVGVDSITGVENGMKDESSELYRTARQIISEAIRQMKDEADIHSPSRVTNKTIGQPLAWGIVRGLSKGMEDSKNDIRESVLEPFIGQNGVISKVVDMVGSEIDVNPRITPVLDLSNVREEAKNLSSILDPGKAEIAGNGIGVSRITSNDGVNNAQNTGNTIQFTQNNYSPKSLSRVDIYRQTKNQLSMIKGMVGE